MSWRARKGRDLLWLLGVLALVALVFRLGSWGDAQESSDKTSSSPSGSPRQSARVRTAPQVTRWRFLGRDGKPVPGVEKWRGKKNPVKWSSSDGGLMKRDARKIFIRNCAPCHGEQGKGDGILAETIPRDQPHPRDFTTGRFKYGSEDWEVMRTIMEAVPAAMMAGWDGRPPPREAWLLVHYVKRLKATPRALSR